MNKKFEKTIKEYQLDQDGFVVGLKGSCTAKDLQKYYDDDFCKELGIKRLDI